MIRAFFYAALLAHAAPASASVVVEPHEAMAAAQDPAAEAALADLRGIAGTGDSGALLSRLADYEATLPLGDIARERLLAEGLRLALGLAPAAASADTLLEAWARREPHTHVWLREGAHGTAIPLHDVGAAARSVQRRWAVLRARDQAHAMLEAGSPGLLDVFAPGAKRAGLAEAREGVALAIRAADRPSLWLWHDAIVDRLVAGERVTGVALAAWERLHSPELALALAGHADPAELVHRLPTLLGGLAASDTPAVLGALLARPELASAALIAAASLAREQPAAKALISARLSDRALGASAALALARIARHDPAVHAELRQLADGADAGLLRQRAQLALDLYASSPEARP